MFQLTQADFHPEPIGNLIKAVDYHRLLSAEELLATAENEARAIIESARDEYARQSTAGYQAGQSIAAEESLQKSIEHHRNVANHLRQLQQQLVDVVLQAVTKIIGELEPSDRIARLIEVSLSELVGQNRVSILVHPEDVGRVERLLTDLRGLQPGLEVIELQSDPRVPLDTCVLSTPKQVIDASLSVQIEGLRNLLLQQPFS